MPLTSHTYATPLGQMLALLSERGLCLLEFSQHTRGLGREIAQAIPEARYLELPTAHFGHSERPVRWLGASVDFLNARPAR